MFCFRTLPRSATLELNILLDRYTKLVFRRRQELDSGAANFWTAAAIRTQREQLSPGAGARSPELEPVSGAGLGETERRVQRHRGDVVVLHHLKHTKLARM